MKRLKTPLLFGFLIGAVVPVFWGLLSFLLFNVPEGWISRVYWKAVYTTCPFWRIAGGKAMILMPLLNGCLYAIITFAVVKVHAFVNTAE
jgi:hypothetical protein